MMDETIGNFSISLSDVFLLLVISPLKSDCLPSTYINISNSVYKCVYKWKHSASGKGIASCIFLPEKNK